MRPIEWFGPEVLGIARSHVHFMEKVVEQLKKEGSNEQQSGIDFFNGMLSVNFLKDGELMSIQYDFNPEERFIEEKWLAEKHKKPRAFEHLGGENGNHT